MTATVIGSCHLVEKLLLLDSNVHLKSSNDFTVFDWLKVFSKQEIIDIFSVFKANHLHNPNWPETFDLTINKESVTNNNELIQAYIQNSRCKEDPIDYDLIVSLLEKIVPTALSNCQSIVIFLPTIREIFKLKQTISLNNILKPIHLVLIYSQMNMSMIDELLDSSKCKSFRIILTTNASQNLISIGNISTVIDTGIDQDVRTATKKLN
jgi:superfamily II DNA/RNA helicase